MRYFSILVFFCFVVNSCDALAEPRKKIGLVLSGGGAKGSAHIGVLKVLEQNNIPVDYIVGTSIGAYVAGMYALGYEIGDIEKIMLSLPWDDGYSDSIPRESLLYADKEQRDRYNLGVRLGYSDGEFKVPHGLLLGQNAYQILRESTGIVHSFKSFDDLAIPYRAVASNIATAQAVVLDSGSINQAMKASAAVPGIVAAVEINGQMLVDGGITNNMPIDVIKLMGADVVIAVDIGSPLSSQNELTSTVAVLNQLSTILTNNTSLEQKELLSEQDILLRPAIDDLSTTDWSVMPKALALGEKEALANIEQLKLLSINRDKYLTYQNQKRIKSEQWFSSFSRVVKAIQYQNSSQLDDDIIAKHFAVEIGKVITKEQLDLAISRVYALDKFEQVSVEFIDEIEGRTLVLQTKEKSWGPNYLDFGFSLKSNFTNRSVTSFNMAYKLTDVTDNGGQWLNEVRIGWETMFATELYQPLDKSQLFFGRAKLEYSHDRWEKNKKRPELINKFTQAVLSTGYNYSNNGIIEIGAAIEQGDLSIDIPHVGDYNYNSYGGFASFNYDNLDSINFPTQGNKLSLAVSWRKDEYSHHLTSHPKDNSIEVNLDWRGALGFKGHTFVGITSFATVDNESDFTVHVSELGGFLNLSGYQEDALIGAHKVFGAVVYQYDLGREVPGGFGLPIYLGTSLEAGNVWQVNESVTLGDLISSGSLYLGTDTSFGPAVFGVGLASGGERTVFLSLGKNW